MATHAQTQHDYSPPCVAAPGIQKSTRYCGMFDPAGGAHVHPQGNAALLYLRAASKVATVLLLYDVHIQYVTVVTVGFTVQGEKGEEHLIR